MGWTVIFIFVVRGNHGNRFKNFNQQIQCKSSYLRNSWVSYTHIHDIHSSKLLDKIDTTHKSLVYCVSLMDYQRFNNDLIESEEADDEKYGEDNEYTRNRNGNVLMNIIEEFGELMENDGLKFDVIMILFVDLFFA